jgi:hypothetical protein
MGTATAPVLVTVMDLAALTGIHGLVAKRE